MEITREEKMIALLTEIRDLLVPISAHYRPQYEQLKKEESKAKIQDFKKLLTPIRGSIFSLLLDPRHLSQVEIARIAQTSQPTVSRFVAQLLENDIIEQTTDKSGNIIFVDKLGLLKTLKKEKEGKS